MRWEPACPGPDAAQQRRCPTTGALLPLRAACLGLLQGPWSLEGSWKACRCTIRGQTGLDGGQSQKRDLICCCCCSVSTVSRADAAKRLCAWDTEQSITWTGFGAVLCGRGLALSGFFGEAHESSAKEARKAPGRPAYLSPSSRHSVVPGECFARCPPTLLLGLTTAATAGDLSSIAAAPASVDPAPAVPVPTVSTGAWVWWVCARRLACCYDRQLFNSARQVVERGCRPLACNVPDFLPHIRRVCDLQGARAVTQGTEQQGRSRHSLSMGCCGSLLLLLLMVLLRLTTALAAAALCIPTPAPASAAPMSASAVPPIPASALPPASAPATTIATTTTTPPEVAPTPAPVAP